MIAPVARASTTSDVFNAIADSHRREVLDALIEGEKAVGAIVNDLVDVPASGVKAPPRAK